MANSKNAKIQLVLSMVLFGTIGLFVRYLSMPSSVIALCRAWIGGLFLLAVLAFRRKTISIQAIKNNLIWLICSGAFLGFNWIALFEAYRHTTVAVATVCYYMAPIIVIFCAPWLLKESLSSKKIVCVSEFSCIPSVKSAGNALAYVTLTNVSGAESSSSGFNRISVFAGIS